MKKWMLVVFAVSLALSADCPVRAQQSGAVPIRIPEAPNPQCINGKTDQVWLTLYRVVTTKDQGFLSRENEAQIIINVQVKTSPQAPQAIAYPLSAKVNIRNYSVGQVSLPVEYTLVSGLALKQNEAGRTVLYTGFSVDTTLVNIGSRNGLGSAIQALTEITGAGKLPIPDSPFSLAAGYLLQFANKAIANDLAAKNADDKLTSALLTLNFDPDGSCAGGFEETGTKAILMAAGAAGNLVPTNKTEEYCWAADVTPAFVLKATKKVAGKPCTDPSYQASYKGVTNNYIAYFLQKRRITTNLAANENARRDARKSKELCDALKIENCPAAR